MGKIVIQPTSSLKSKKPDMEELTQQALAVTRLNDKELTELEIDYERKAEILTIEKFPRIHPMRATIGFMTRNAKGGNYQMIEYIRMALPANALSTGRNNLADLITDFDNLDLASQQRIDCLDWLCRKNKVTIMRFIDALKDGIVAWFNNETAITIAQNKPDLAAKIFKDALGEDKKSIVNKRLAAEIGGLSKSEPLVNIDQSQKTQVNIQNNVVLSFSDFIKKNDKEIRGKEENKHFDVEAEIVNE
jgi:hypothetical protein